MTRMPLYNQDAPTEEPSLKRPPVLSACNSEITRRFTMMLQPLVSLIVDTIVAQYISHIFTIPINLVLDESEFCKVVLPQDLLSGTQASCTTTLLLDTLIAKYATTTCCCHHETGKNQECLPPNTRCEVECTTVTA